MANVSSSNGLEKRPKLRFPGFDEPYRAIKLGQISSLIKRNDPRSNAPIMMLSAGNGFIMQSDKYSRDNAGQSLKKYTLLKKGELAYNHGASKVKQFGCCYELREEEARIPYVYHCFKVQGTEYTPYVALELNNTKMDKQLKRLVSSSVRMDGLLNISYDEYMSVVVYLPAYAEQKHIADFLEKLDMRIAKQEQLIESLKKYKRGAVDAILSRKLIIHKTSPWSEMKISDLFSPISEKGHGELTVLTIVQGIGTQPRDSVDRRISYDKSTTNTYKRVCKNDFILHLRSFEGGLEIANSEGIVSPAYTILRAKREIVPMFYYAYFRSYWFISNKLRIAVEGIRDGKSINMDTFWNILVPCPSIEEQHYIAEYLHHLDARTSKEEALLARLQMIRSGFMQQLFI